MNRYPEYIEIDNKKYKINTNFRDALRCDEIVRDTTIGEYEKGLAIIYVLLGEEALKDEKNYAKMLQLLLKYLRCGKDIEEVNEEAEPSMSFKQDTGYIKASFMSDYKMDLDKTNLHYWAFIDLLNGLTENSILNRVRMIREEPLNDKKGKELTKWKKMKEQVKLKQEKTQEQKELDKFWNSQFQK